MEQFLDKILEHFFDKCKIQELSTEHSGLINETFRIKTNYGSFILQKINDKVFKNTGALLNNKTKVTNFLNLKKFPTAQFVKTKEGKDFCLVNKDIWQLSKTIESQTYDKILNQEMAAKAGSFLASFHNVLLDFPINELKETIPDFHNNIKRFEDFKAAIAVADKSKILAAQPEIDTMLYFYSIVQTISEAIHNKLLPIRVVHNDTKINNLLFDHYGSILCMIDYDTIMPGCILSDIGDAMRTGACSSV
jgi:N-acetylhexosamine 1-kinase